MLTTVILRDPRQQCWFLYHQPVEVVWTRVSADVVRLLSQLERRVEHEGLFAAGYVAYGAAPGFDEALPGESDCALPLICFALYESRQRLESLTQFDPQGADSSAITPAVTWSLSTPRSVYVDRVENLRRHISEGDAYQVNLTANLQAQTLLGFPAFRRMAVESPYGAYLEGDDFTIVSASPELFFELADGLISSKPMKGTVPRGLDSESDLRARDWLAQSKKNRAENLMITDMMRNDLGRIANPGSVAVPALFDVEQYPTVWQMTSTVTAQTRAGITEIFRALFPGASITGAPKRAAMGFINTLEDQPRSIYTGTIGVIEPGGRAQFNVAIRTAWSDKRTGVTHYGAGGGIVWDSDPADEYQELLAKTQILYATDQDFELLETLRWTPTEGYYLCERHLDRLEASARYFRFYYDRESVMEALQQAHDDKIAVPQRVRLTLNRNGACRVQQSAMGAQPAAGSPQLVKFVSTPVDKSNVLLYHKTTARDVYTAAAREVPPEVEGLLFNQQGYVTESTIANVVYQLAGSLYTPPIDDGLLPGTLRAWLLEQGEIAERSLHKSEADKVDQWFLINALRGWREAKLCP